MMDEDRLNDLIYGAIELCKKNYKVSPDLFKKALNINYPDAEEVFYKLMDMGIIGEERFEEDEFDEEEEIHVGIVDKQKLKDFSKN